MAGGVIVEDTARNMAVLLIKDPLHPSVFLLMNLNKLVADGDPVAAFDSRFENYNNIGEIGLKILPDKKVMITAAAVGRCLLSSSHQAIRVAAEAGHTDFPVCGVSKKAKICSRTNRPLLKNLN